MAILSGPAQAIDPNLKANNFCVVAGEQDESVFNYIDTASSRYEIDLVSAKLALEKVAIVGLGGTGSDALDLVAKTPVKQIHLFDGDKFLQHNAFRSPGAASGDELEEKLYKTLVFERLYSKMRRGIFSHSVFIDSANVDQLKDMNFVFLCLDDGIAAHRQELEQFAVPFVDVGMGIYKAEGSWRNPQSHHQHAKAS